VTFANGLLTYLPPGSYLGNDRFSYTLADSFGATATGNVYMTITTANTRLVNATNISAQPPGTFNVAYTSLLPYYPFSIQYATNLNGLWQLAGPGIVADSNGGFHFLVTNTAGIPQQFFRVRYP
jgi:hypothetical protein